jgi:uncharacterized protein
LTHYFLKLNPCRPTFAMDMNDEERSIMKQHVAYWQTLMQQGKVVVFGPVMDPKEPYGMGIIEADSDEAIQAFIAGDPASKINTYEFYPMRAVLPSA